MTDVIQRIRRQSLGRGLSGPVIGFKVRYKVGDGGNWINQITNNNSIDINTGLVPEKTLIVQVKAVGPEPDRKESNYQEHRKRNTSWRNK